MCLRKANEESLRKRSSRSKRRRFSVSSNDWGDVGVVGDVGGGCGGGRDGIIISLWFSSSGDGGDVGKRNRSLYDMAAVMAGRCCSCCWR